MRKCENANFTVHAMMDVGLLFSQPCEIRYEKLISQTDYKKTR